MDILYSLLTLVFFGVMVFYTAACHALGAEEEEPRQHGVR